MTYNIGQIANPGVLLEPSKRLLDYIKSIKPIEEGTPVGIQNLVYKNKPKGKQLLKQPRPEYLITDRDKTFISSLDLRDSMELFKSPSNVTSSPSEKALTLHDLHWLYSYIQSQNKLTEAKVYLHELMEGSQVILPKNEEIPRNEELEKRCQKLKVEQQNKEYNDMTKNVDGFRRKLPEDTISYQLKMMNAHLIAVFQFVVSVLTGFAFGFIGIELLIGSLNFELRIMLGIVCALVIAMAELYFLAKKLNEDLEFENMAKKPDQGKKLK